ncbi:type I methionyl aminopeptidase [Paenibacillus beijingensis]|uniref:Methionine aminopeptidase n=1 Tax=Paenibacillus beijingensis TaxID=1126833 RepID=A0A0D5NHQ0_9BACL|nr:type I methionyl aminopeptidase [Paenibacillus beijingensis]AJY74453.1 methionine aminopeptidase [Paenibacillus beijingensis]
MTELKTEEEIGCIRKAGRVVAECHQAIARRIAPGVTTLEIDRFVERMMVERGARPAQKGYRGYPFATCASVNEIVCHGFPDTVPLQQGDIVTIDMVADVDGWKADSAWTYTIGKGSPQVEYLLKTAKQALFRGIQQALPGRRIGDIGQAVRQHAESSGFAVVPSFVGHGIGRDIHEPPEVSHVARAGSGGMLRDGTVLTIEPILTIGRPEVWIGSDGWTAQTRDGSWSAQFEHTVAVTAAGPVILTAL